MSFKLGNIYDLDKQSLIRKYKELEARNQKLERTVSYVTEYYLLDFTDEQLIEKANEPTEREKLIADIKLALKDVKGNKV